MLRSWLDSALPGAGGALGNKELLWAESMPGTVAIGAGDAAMDREQGTADRASSFSPLFSGAAAGKEPLRIAKLPPRPLHAHGSSGA